MEELKQFKSLDDLQRIISKLEGFAARPITKGRHPTLYPDTKDGDYRTIQGIRVVDYKFSADEKWILPDDQRGLSFSANWKELKRVYRLVSRAKKSAVDVYWVLQGADLPKDMAFVEDKDPKKKGHYFLTVTTPMTVYKLVHNLKWIADRMTVIRNAERAL